MNDRVDLDVIHTYPLSPQQRDLLALGALAAYAASPVTLTVALGRRLDAHAARRAFDTVVASHEILRTAFRQERGYATPRQCVLAHGSPGWSVVEASGAAHEQSVTFDLEFGRTLHLTLLQLANGESALRWEASPLVADRASLAALHRQLIAQMQTEAHVSADAQSEDNADPLEYAQYAEWRDELLQGDDAAQGRQYWRDYLQRVGATPSANDDSDAPLLAAPVLAERRERESTEQVVHRQIRVLPASVQSALTDLAGRTQLTVATIAHAAWWALVARVSGQRAWLAGWQHDCRRDYEQLSATIGPFATTLPLVLDVPLDLTFGAFAASLGAMLDEHRNVQEYWSLSERAAALGVTANGTRESDAGSTLKPHCTLLDCFVCGFAVSSGDAPVAGSKCDASSTADSPFAMPRVFEFGIEIVLHDSDTLAAVALHHRADMYSDAAMASLVDQYVTLLQHLPHTFDQPIARQRLLSAAQREALLGWSGPRVGIGSKTVPHRVHEFAAATPEAIALQGRDLDGAAVSLDYRALDLKVRTVAAQLAACGVTTGSTVGLLLPRGTDQVIGLLAAMWLGAAYLPLDPAWPAARRDTIVALARPSLVIAAESLLGGTPQTDADTVPYRTFAQLESALTVSASERIPAAPVCTMTDAAYVLFTSGSTGTPKGVVIEHAQLANYVSAATTALALDHCARFALTSTVAADLGNTVLFGALANGAALVVADDAAMENGAAFGAFVRHHAIDCLKIVPSHLEALLDADDASLPATVVLGGERASSRLLTAVRNRFASTQVFNHYGPTETTIGVATHRVGSAEPDANADAFGAHGLPLTEPLANCRLLLLDNTLEPVPPGVTGELYVGGAQLCRGYLQQDGADAFIDSPFHPGERLYRTGDLGRYRAGGGIVLLGRADDQVKIRGFRVDPAEVEAVLQRCEGVGQAVVHVLRESETVELVGYVVRAAGAGTPETGADANWLASIRENLAASLPAAMQPRYIEILTGIPRLPNGKVNRRALPEPRSTHDAAVADTQGTAPRSSLETWLVTLWTELLGARPGIHDDFFSLGGQSLLIVRMVTRINEALRVKIRPGEIYVHPTIATLASHLAATDDNGAQIEKIAALRLQLAAMSPEEQAALRARAGRDKPAASST